MDFKLEKTSRKSQARAGAFTLNDIKVQTPVFMPVGTAASVKAVHQWELEEKLRSLLILANTYHLYNRPGMDVIEQAGGLHAFMGWEGLILTDSGGYQVYSLSQKRKITEEGVNFQSHFDGSSHMFTPEKVVEIQRRLGSDITMAFDECPPFPSDHAYAKKSMELTHRWLDRNIEAFKNSSPRYGRQQVLLPICQGSTFPDLRKQSAAYIAEKDLPANAIGGLSVGEPEAELYDMTAQVCSILPAEKPRYLMGVGTPSNLLECIARGVDMFDCVMPTRHARNGNLFTMNGTINIRNKKWKYDYRPLHETPIFPTDQYYSRAYLRHLHQSNEILGSQIASLNNLLVYFRLISEARQHILNDTFESWYPKMTETLKRRL